MRSFDGSNVSIDFEKIVDQTFDVFDEVFFIDEKNNKIFKIKSNDEFNFISKSKDASNILEQFKDSIYPDDKKIFEMFNPFAGKLFTAEVRCKNKHGDYRWCYIKLIPVSGSSFFAMFLDMSSITNDGIKAKNEYLKKQLASDYQCQLLNQKYMAVVNHTQIMAFEIDLKTKIISINSNLKNKYLFESDYSDTIDNFRNSNFIHENDKTIFDTIPAKLERVRYTSANIRMLDNDGQYFNSLVHFYGVYDNGGVLSSIVGSVLEIDNVQKECIADSELESRTGLLNSKAFCTKMEEMLKNSGSERYALILFDVEQFKSVNEFYGVEFADDVIRFIAYNLKSMFINEKCIATCFLSDYFGIFTNYFCKEELIKNIEDLNSKITYYKNIKLKYAYGIYEINDKLMQARFICDYANMARKAVKGNHINRISFYNENMINRIIEDINIENDMERALNEREFSMYLQPKYNMQNGKIVGAEALVRWEHPIKGIIGPYKFIPLFEKNGFIMKLDAFMWEEACRAIKRWSDAGIPAIPISVNVSRMNVSDPNLVKIIDGLIEKYGIEKKYLELEITETVYYEDQVSLMKILSELKQSGYTLLMDDFGSGFSSLSMLENTPFDVLKIDRSFFNENSITDKGKKIIRHTICLSNDIGLNIVAEGVETKEQVDYLLQCGCFIAQGYYYSKPISISEFEKLIGYKS